MRNADASAIWLHFCTHGHDEEHAPGYSMAEVDSKVDSKVDSEVDSKVDSKVDSELPRLLRE